MKKIMFAVMAVAVSLMFAGCASVQVAKDKNLNDQRLTASGKTIAHINAQNWGFYFLKWPIFTGSVTAPGKIAVFDEDSVNVPSTAALLTAEAKKLGATATLDMQSERSSMMFPLPIPFLFYIQSTNVSGNAVR